MNKYELMFIVDAHLSPDEKTEVSKQAADAVGKVEGKVINSSVWLDKHRLTFPIQKRQEGTYYLVNFEAKTASLVKLRQTLKLNEKVLRSLILRAQEKKAKA